MNALTKRNKQSKDATKKLIKDLIKENIEQEFRPTLDKAVKETASTVRKTTIAEVLYNMHERGRTKDEILGFYEDMVNLDYRKNLYNKTISNYDALAFMSEQYGIDFDRLDTDFAVKER
jgi:anthranilate phosphoribosyltransferase